MPIIGVARGVQIPDFPVHMIQYSVFCEKNSFIEAKLSKVRPLRSDSRYPISMPLIRSDSRFPISRPNLRFPISKKENSRFPISKEAQIPLCHP